MARTMSMIVLTHKCAHIDQSVLCVQWRGQEVAVLVRG